MLIAEMVGLLAGFLTAFSTVPQSLKIIKHKRSSDVSTSTILMLNGSYVLWLTYGIMLNLISVIIWNIVALAFGMVILYLKILVWPDHQTPKIKSSTKPRLEKSCQ